MRKHLSFVLGLALLASCAGSPEKQLEIQGSVADKFLNGKQVFLLENGMKKDSVVVSDQQFCFKTAFDSVQVFSIAIEGKNKFETILADKSGSVTVSYEKGGKKAQVDDNGGVNTIKNSVAESIRNFLMDEGLKLKEMREKGTASEIIDSLKRINREKADNMWKEAVKANAENLAGAAVFADNYYQSNAREFIELYGNIRYAHLFPALKNRKQVCENFENTKAGKMFVDFKGKDLNGKETALSDYVGKGKYVLVDFWASWCGPCRAEIPNIINVYNRFKGDHFTVVGVDVWDQEIKFKKAVEEEKIEYPQIYASDDNKAGTLYGIEGIPHIILFGPDGTIIHRGLRGKEIPEAVEKVLKK